MNALDAIHHAATHAPGGIAALAPRMGKSVHTLRHELAGAPGHKLGLMDAVLMAQMLGSPRLADAVACEAGGMFVPLAFDAAGEPIADIADAMRELSELTAALGQSYRDDKISANELANIETQAADVIAVLHRIVGAAKAAHAKSQPAGAIAIRKAA
jgi:hypothetical protein